jgi:hypothetical protein
MFRRSCNEPIEIPVNLWTTGSGRIAFRFQTLMELLSDIAEYIKRVLASPYRFGRRADLAAKNGSVLPIGTIH